MNVLLKTKVDCLAQQLADHAVQSLVDEARLTPKPGLVDLRGSGSHQDMDCALLEASARSLYLAFYHMVQAAYGRGADQALRNQVGAIGREGEKAMMQTTGGINTHRGAIWALGLIISAYACYEGKASSEEILKLATAISRIPDQYAPALLNKGRFISKKFQVPGAREEAQHGFVHVKKALLTLYKARLLVSETEARLHALLAIMTTLTDTCVLSRGGIEGLQWVQHESRAILNVGGLTCSKGRDLFQAFDHDMMTRRLSPGGAADLLAATLLVDRLSKKE